MATLELEGERVKVPSTVVTPTPDRAVCRQCGKVKRADEFPRHRATGLYHILSPCKKCYAENGRQKSQ